MARAAATGRMRLHGASFGLLLLLLGIGALITLTKITVLPRIKHGQLLHSFHSHYGGSSSIASGAGKQVAKPASLAVDYEQQQQQRADWDTDGGRHQEAAAAGSDNLQGPVPGLLTTLPKKAHLAAVESALTLLRGASAALPFLPAPKAAAQLQQHTAEVLGRQGGADSAGVVKWPSLRRLQQGQDTGTAPGSSSSSGSAPIDWATQFDQQGQPASAAASPVPTGVTSPGATGGPGDPTAGDNSDPAAALLAQGSPATSPGLVTSLLNGPADSSGASSADMPNQACTSSADCTGATASGTLGNSNWMSPLVCPPASLAEAPAGLGGSTTPPATSADPLVGSSPPPTTSSSSQQRVCAVAPSGGLWVAADVAGPLYYYPLAGGRLDSWPNGALTGSASGDFSWAMDEVMLLNATVLACGPGAPKVTLQSPQYGTSGAFTVSFWVRVPQLPTTSTTSTGATSSSSSGWQYLFSQSSKGADSAVAADGSSSGAGSSSSSSSSYSTFLDNSINIYLGAPGTDMYGVVRAVVKDSNDPQDANWIQSDGTIASTSTSQPGIVPVNVTDGGWHHVLLTTTPSTASDTTASSARSTTVLPRGYQLYIDGLMVAQMEPAQSASGADSSSSSGGGGGASGQVGSSGAGAPDASFDSNPNVDGGEPLTAAQGPITLCGRTDGDATRYFTGRLTQLQVFDRALTAGEVKRVLQAAQPALLTAATTGAAFGPSASPAVGADSIWQSSSASPSPTAGIDAATTSPSSADSPPLVRSASAPSFLDGTTAGGGPLALDATGSSISSSSGGSSCAGGDLQWDSSSGSACDLEPMAVRCPRYCETGQVCYAAYAASTSSSSATSPGSTGSSEPLTQQGQYTPVQEGWCAPAVPGLLLPRSYPTPWPTPLAYFPLTQDPLRSYPPSGDYSFNGTVTRVTLTSDARFGSVVSCDANQQSSIALDPVDYAYYGTFSIGIWVRLPPGGLADVAAAQLQYVFSHGAAGASGSIINQPNEVAIFFPGPEHPRYGVLRVVVRDGDDDSSADSDTNSSSSDTSEDLDGNSDSSTAGSSSRGTWLDSDGRVGDNTGWQDPSTPGPDAVSSGVFGPAAPVDPTQSNPNLVNFEDGQWHHVLVSTLPSGEPGYRLYVDGVRRAELSQSRNRAWQPDLSSSRDRSPRVQVTGGDPATLDGPITLCARSDHDPTRYFSGSLAGLQLWDWPMGDADVAALYAEWVQQGAIYPQEGAGAARFSKRGARCLFPISYGGTLQYDCILVEGVPSCPTGPRGEFEECAPPAFDPSSNSSSTATSQQDGSSPPSSSSGGGGDWSPPTDGAAAAALAAALGATLVNPTGQLPRYTTSGQRCSENFTVRGVNFTMGECAWVWGEELCHVVGADDLVECAPLVQLPINSTVCYSNAAALMTSSAVSPGDAFSKCVTVLGLEFCQLAGAGDAWVRCPYAPARAALSGATCQLPFKLGGVARSDCVGQGPDADSATEYCPAATGQTSSGGQTSNQQLQLTVCSPAEPYPGGVVPDPRDTTTSKPWGLARDWQLLQGLVPAPGSGTRRYSISGQTSCLPSTNPAATAIDDAWATARSGSRSSSRSSSSPGSSSSSSGGAVGDPSTPPAGGGVCVLDADKGQFECTVAVGAAPQMCAPLGRSTTSGRRCSFPFMADGVARDDCVWSWGMEICPVEISDDLAAAPGSIQNIGGGGTSVGGVWGPNGVQPRRGLVWEQCAPGYVTSWDVPSSGLKKRWTTNGAACLQPFEAAGNTFWDCLPLNTTNSSSSTSSSDGSSAGGVPPAAACPLGSGEWATCAAVNTTLIRRTTNPGVYCQLPFGDRGALHHDCIKKRSGSAGQCKDSAGQWRRCVATRTTTSGTPCVFPLVWPTDLSPWLPPQPGQDVVMVPFDFGSDSSGGTSNMAPSSSGISSSSIMASQQGGQLVTDCVLLPESMVQGLPDFNSNPDSQVTGVCFANQGGNLTLQQCAPQAVDPRVTMVTPNGGSSSLQDPVNGQTSDSGSYLGAAVPQPGTTTSASYINVVPVAVGVAVGLGGGLLLAALVLLVAVKRGYVYHWRSRKFHEMHDAVDPIAAASGTAGNGSSGGAGTGGGHLAVPVFAKTGDSAGDDRKDAGWVAGATKNLKGWVGAGQKRQEGSEIELRPSASAEVMASAAPGDDAMLESGISTPAKTTTRNMELPADFQKVKRLASGFARAFTPTRSPSRDVVLMERPLHLATSTSSSSFNWNDTANTDQAGLFAGQAPSYTPELPHPSRGAALGSAGDQLVTQVAAEVPGLAAGSRSGAEEQTPRYHPGFAGGPNGGSQQQIHAEEALL